MRTPKHYPGAVSLFVVIFATLLISVVTVSFIRLMLSDQRAATTLDLSQSAYDSAQAGVEDAKRALLRYQTICSGGDAAACNAVLADITSGDCNRSLNNIVDVSGDEVQVQQSSGDAALDQAYTCVLVTLDTPDFLGVMQSDEAKLIPLNANRSFNAVTIEWFSNDDLTSTNYSVDVPSINASSSLPLLAQGAGGWTSNRPPILRAQLIQVGSSFNLSDFDSTGVAESNANTLFLYPVRTGGASSIGFSTFDQRRSPTSEPQRVNCKTSLVGGGYACTATLTLPNPVGGGDRTAFLRLLPYYNKTNYRVSLSNNALFDAVQPEIDATGRANDLFRRVKARVEMQDVNFAYPDATASVGGNICKDFVVTDNANDFQTYCTP